MKTLLFLIIFATSTYASENTRIDCKVRVSSLEQFYVEIEFQSPTVARSTYFNDMGAGELRIAIPSTDVKRKIDKRIVTLPIQINTEKNLVIHLPEKIFTSKEEMDVESSSGSWVTDTYCWAK